MRTLSPGSRKIALTVHLVVSVGWIGAVVAYLALVVAAWTGTSRVPVRAVWISLEVIGWDVLVPLSIASLATGLVVALGTPWGLFSHYWVVFSLVLTVFAVLVLLGHMPTVSRYADLARSVQGAGRAPLSGELVHGGGGLLVLLVVAILNVYKPRGRTPYGRRKREERPSTSDREP